MIKDDNWYYNCIYVTDLTWTKNQSDMDREKKNKYGNNTKHPETIKKTERYN